jgi:acetyl esterase/lipase
MRAAARGAMRTDWIVRLAGRKRANGADTALDRQVAAALEFQRVARLPDLDTMTPVDARRFAEEGMAPLELDPAPMAEVIDTTVPGAGGDIPVRIYVPEHAGLDWLVYLHGGGGVIGSIRGSDPVTRYVAAHTRCTVASVGYRLGPEHKHPAAIEDAAAAWRAMVERVPAGGRIAVGGDSFGGFLSAHVDRHAMLTGVRQPDVQVLIYPMVDLTFSSASLDRLAHGYLLTKAMMQWFRDHYLHDTDDRRAASPWFWEDVEGAAPAIVATAGYDPLVDEGRAWAERLRAAGTPVTARHHPGLVHGFLSLAGAVVTARAAIDQICTDVVDHLRRPGRR